MAFPVKDKYLLINGLSGAVSLVSEETAKKFFEGEVTPELKPFFTHATPEEEEKNAQSLCEFLVKSAAKCIDSFLAVTYDCNLRCPYCCEIWVKQPETMRMVLDEYKVDKAFEALDLLNRECEGKKLLTLTGGEPFMKKNKDIVEYILKKGREHGYSFRVLTNGVDLTYFLPALSSVDVYYVQITLDGPPHVHDKRRVFKKGTGTFDTIVGNIEEARAMGIPLLIRTNTNSEILTHIDELAHFFRERGWVDDPHVQFSLAYTCDQHGNPAKYDEMTKTYEDVMDVSKRPEMDFLEAYPFGKLHSLFGKSPRFWPAFWNCNASRTMYAFDPFGDIYPCPSMSGWKEERIGVYVPELSFNEKWDQWKKRTLFTLEKCAECEIALVCGGGCGYAALLNNGDLFSPVCTTTKRIVLSYVDYLYEIRNPSTISSLD